MRIMNLPGVRLSRCTIPTHLSRVLKSAFSMLSQSVSPDRIAAAYSYTLLKMVVASLASLTFSIGLPSSAREIASSGRNDVPVLPVHFFSICASGRWAEKGVPMGETAIGVPVTAVSRSALVAAAAALADAGITSPPSSAAFHAGFQPNSACGAA